MSEGMQGLAIRKRFTYLFRDLYTGHKRQGIHLNPVFSRPACTRYPVTHLDHLMPRFLLGNPRCPQNCLQRVKRGRHLAVDGQHRFGVVNQLRHHTRTHTIITIRKIHIQKNDVSFQRLQELENLLDRCGVAQHFDHLSTSLNV